MSVNLGRVAYVEKGAYDSGTTYEKKDVVLFNSGSYVFIADTPAAGKQPTDTAYWQPLIDPAPMLEATANATEAAAAANEARQNIQKDLAGKAPAIFADASGDIVQITDGAEGMPVKSLITTIVPKEDGTGWDEVNVTGTGKNLFGGKALAEALKALSPSTITIDENAGTVTFHAGNAGSNRLFNVKNSASRYTVVLKGKNSNYTNTNIAFYYTDGTYSIINFESVNTVSTIVAYSSPGKQVLSFGTILYGGSTVLYYNDCGLFEGILTQEDFAAYKGKTLTAALPETVTNGALDWVSGILTKDDGSTAQLTPQQLETLKGTNNIWSDAGETEVTYAADTKMYIDQKIAAIAAAIV